MNDRFPQLKPKELISALKRLGFLLKRQTGSHAIFRQPITRKIAVVPIHAKDLKRGLLFGILKQINLTVEDLQKNLS